MAKKGNKSVSRKNQYAAYKTNGSYKKNRVAKLERHLKKYPDDAQAAAALKNVSETPRRTGSHDKLWSKNQIEVAQMFSKVGINGNHALGGKASEKVGDEEHKRYYGDAKYDRWQKKRWEEEDKAEARKTKAKAKAVHKTV